MSLPPSSDLIALFNQSFFVSHRTRLIGGAGEPLYLPMGANRDYHGVFFRQDYFRSALHEIAHWLLAGAKRRMQVDYGYWYVPEGRDAQQQRAFEQVEARPQAMEWILSQASGIEFVVSIDNFVQNEASLQRFKHEIYHALARLIERGLPDRARFFFERLCDLYQTDPQLNVHVFRHQMFADGHEAVCLN